MDESMGKARIGIVGGGPAGLMAAEAAAGEGAEVVLFDAMPTLGRKLLMAGKSGLNLTHAEAHDLLRTRYGSAASVLQPALDAFDGAALRQWCAGLGVETFVGSSGRVFPTAMKASPLLRAWLGRLAEQGVEMRTRWRWTGWHDGAVRFDTPSGGQTERFDALVLALGGASWPRLGSNGAWAGWLAGEGIPVAPFRPANCAFEVDWSPIFAERFAGEPVKAVTANGVMGEFVVTRWGIEGSLVYVHAAALRDALDALGSAALTLDLAPGRTEQRLIADLSRQPAKASFTNRLRKGAGLDGVKLGLVRELLPEAATLPPEALARHIKALALPVQRTRPLAEAISTAGGVAWAAVDQHFMLTALPGVFVAGEMLDWEAPTGGYLLTACFATGRAAGRAAARFAQ
jgi:uncharacterized flavoprotein (TIGR03862 family)